MHLDHLAGGAAAPAQKAGIKPGDVIVSMDGKALSSPNALPDKIEHLTGQPVTLGVERDGHLRHVTVTPVDARGLKVGGSVLAPASAKSPHGFVGVETEQTSRSVNPLHAVTLSAQNIWAVTTGEIAGIGHLFAPSGISSVIHQVSNSKDAAQVAANPGHSVRPISLIGIVHLGSQSQQDGIFFLLEILDPHQYRFRAAQYAAHAPLRRWARGDRRLRMDPHQEGRGVLQGRYHQAVPGGLRGDGLLGHLRGVERVSRYHAPDQESLSVTGGADPWN